MSGKQKTKKTTRVSEMLPNVDDLAKGTAEPTFQLSALFVFKELKLKDDMQWRIKIVVKEQLPQTFREYDGAFSFNEGPYEAKIDDVEKRKDAIVNEETLFPAEREKQLRVCDLTIGDIQRDMEKARKDTPTMEFKAIVEQLAYKDGDTVLTMIISHDVVEKIDEYRHYLKNYKLDLIRE